MAVIPCCRLIDDKEVCIVCGWRGWLYSRASCSCRSRVLTWLIRRDIILSTDKIHICMLSLFETSTAVRRKVILFMTVWAGFALCGANIIMWVFTSTIMTLHVLIVPLFLWFWSTLAFRFEPLLFLSLVMSIAWLTNIVHRFIRWRWVCHFVSLITGSIGCSNDCNSMVQS